MTLFWDTKLPRKRSIFMAWNGGNFGGQITDVFPWNGPISASCEIKLRLILCTFWRPIWGLFWPSFWRPNYRCFPHKWASWNNTSYYFMHILGAHFRWCFPLKWPSAAAAILGVIILVYVHQWPFRATGAPSVCQWPFRAIGTHSASGPLGPLALMHTQFAQRANCVCSVCAFALKGKSTHSTCQRP